jgi:hypothetical protein
LAARVPTARAASETACRKGCLWSAGKDYRSRAAGCEAIRAEAEYTMLAIGIFPWLAVSLSSAFFAAGLRYASCVDHNVLQAKAAGYDCLQPNCAGFNPRKAGGPCDGCQVKCCTCQASDNGYICCIFECDDASHSCCPGG